jgi:hypothetical protein
MRDNQLKKLTRVVRKLAAEVASLRKLIRRELLGKASGTDEPGKKARKKSKKKGGKASHQSPDAAPPAA